MEGGEEAGRGRIEEAAIKWGVMITMFSNGARRSSSKRTVLMVAL